MFHISTDTPHSPPCAYVADSVPNARFFRLAANRFRTCRAVPDRTHSSGFRWRNIASNPCRLSWERRLPAVWPVSTCDVSVDAGRNMPVDGGPRCAEQQRAVACRSCLSGKKEARVQILSVLRTGKMLEISHWGLFYYEKSLPPGKTPHPDTAVPHSTQRRIRFLDSQPQACFQICAKPKESVPLAAFFRPAGFGTSIRVQPSCLCPPSAQPRSERRLGADRWSPHGQTESRRFEAGRLPYHEHEARIACLTIGSASKTICQPQAGIDAR